MAEEDAVRTIVIDNGSGVIKAGYAGEEAPRVLFPSKVGSPIYPPVMIGCWDQFVGDAAQSKRAILRLKSPVERGIVTNWDDMEKIWQYAFSEKLEVDTKAHRVLLTQAPFNTMANRERMSEIMFEKFDVPALSIRIPAVLSLFASGRMTGCVLESGHGVSHTVAVHEGVALPHSVELLDVGGRDVTAYLGRLLYESGYRFFFRLPERRYLPGIKEKLAYVALDLDEELKKADESLSLEKSYELPDGTGIILNSERFHCTEPLFNPSLAGSSEMGVHFRVKEAIRHCHVDLHKELYSNIVLAGGNALYPGLVERMTREVSVIAPPGTEVKAQLVHNTPVPYLNYAAWLGGCIAASISSCGDTLWISKAEYEESGASIVRRKCRRGSC